MTNDFERDLRKLDDVPNFKKALIEVCDTAYMCRQFLNTFVGEAKFTAADIIALTALVIAAERRIEAADSAGGPIRHRAAFGIGPPSSRPRSRTPPLKPGPVSD